MTRTELIAAAREEYGSDAVNIDDDAQFSDGEDGTWVSAWVFIDDEHVEGDEPMPVAEQLKRAAEIYAESLAEIFRDYGDNEEKEENYRSDEADRFAHEVCDILGIQLPTKD